jgi:hypothetical protein
MKDSQISDLKQRMEDMAIEFGDMLKETLDKMTDRCRGRQSPVLVPVTAVSVPSNHHQYHLHHYQCP